MGRSGSRVRYLLGTAGVQPWVDAPMFETVFLPPYRCWRALMASALFHCVLIPSLPLLGRLLPETDEAALRRQAFVVRPLEIRISDLYYMPPKNSSSRPRSRQVSKAALLAPAPKPKIQAQGAKSRKASPRRFELPELARRVETGQTVLQPQYPPDLPLQQRTRLPNVVFWSTPQLPKPEPKRFVQPGRRTPTIVTPAALEAPPKLELPNKELAVSDLRITGGVISDHHALPLPPSTTIPVRVFSPPSPSKAADGGVSLDALPGDPTNLIAISPNPAPLAPSMLVPAGNQLGQLPGPPLDGTASGGSATEGGSGGSVGGVGGAPGGRDAGGVAALAGGGGLSAGIGTGSGMGAGSGGTGSGSGGSGSGRGGGAVLGGAGQAEGRILALSSPPSTLGPAAAAKVVHPNNAVYDVVIQSASSDVLPDTAGLLSGKPVYTVYVQAGAQRDWMLQYCRPGEAERILRSRGNVVRLGVPAPIKAPYPLVTAIPPITLEPRADPIMVHGLLDRDGRLKALKLVRDSGRELRDQLLPFLEKWEFRPGTRDGLPVLLEILLVIPANRA